MDEEKDLTEEQIEFFETTVEGNFNQEEHQCSCRRNNNNE